MIIQCPDCGHDVSDKAAKCPKCGYPMQSEEPQKQPQQKNKTWLWITLAIVAVAAIGGGVWFLLNNTGDDPNAIVELTPDFIEKVQKYDKLAPFSEGLAAVKRDGLWGYIDTKGEEVIPCQYLSSTESGVIGAQMFHDGMAQVYKDGTGYYIDRKGEIMFKGEGGRFSDGVALMDDGRIVDKKGNTKFTISLYGNAYAMGNEYGKSNYTRFPYYEDGVLCVYVNEGDSPIEKYYDTNGKQVSASKPTITEKEYSVFWDEEDYSEFRTGNFKGLKDKSGNVVIPAKYSEIGTPYPDGTINEPIVSNGVVLVAIRENDAYYRTEHQIQNFQDGMSEIYTPRYYAYADLIGNTTFSNATMSKIKDTERLGKQYWKAKIEEERTRKEVESKRGPEWIDGTWEWRGYHEGMYLGCTISFNRETGRYALSYDGGHTEVGKYTYVPDTQILQCRPDGSSGHYTSYEVDTSNNRISLGYGKYMKKTYNSSSTGSYSHSDSKGQSENIHFYTDADVIGWLSDKTFYCEGSTLRVTNQGVRIDGNYLTGAPMVCQFSGSQAVIKANPIVGAPFTLRLNAARGTIEQGGDLWKLRK